MWIRATYRRRTTTPYSRDFYDDDPLTVARNLLGSLLVYEHPERGQLVGRIVETEAYRDTDDQACHAHKGLTPRTRTMFGPPGHAYVYLIYGMYSMLNAVTWPDGRPAAVLLRAIEPVQGIERTTDGPGKLTRAMDIRTDLNDADLVTSSLYIASDRSYPDAAICRGPRIGINYAGTWTQKPWRFYVGDNKYVSKAR